MLSELTTAMLTQPNRVVTPEGVRIVRTVIEGQPVFFSVLNQKDRIQRKMWRGNFYEPEELEIIRAHFPKNGIFCDIGANVGNHSLFSLIYLGASKSIVFEPNPGAYDLLVLNMILNGVSDRVDFSFLGCGLSDHAEENVGLALREGNLGATRLVSGEGEVSILPGDTMLSGAKVDFIKIDVEGMEIAVLGGLKETIAANRPPIFLEIEHVNRDALEAWLSDAGYQIAVEGRQFQHNGNLLLLPA